ncbi:hypothetical protein FALBO_11543 [Fusarium albosuccineum]|uniref:Uncharacterized protein n=1 Tax=Fusarium albosuccineum TaxID=1237068 RepID=A0A8H4L3M5_9HYPO|nr:hypothetical protein FALBO_11543 [Fusarium albosuccineum]
MDERFPTDYPHLSRAKFMPGAMGVQVVKPSDSNQGYEIYYHSSMRMTNMKHERHELQLAESFRKLVIQDNGDLPVHRRDYRCTEPGLFTNSTEANPEHNPSSRIYIVDSLGQFLPPCGGDNGDVVPETGCAHIVAKFDAITIGDGAAATNSTVGNKLSYFWYHPIQNRPRICCVIPSRIAAKIAHNVVDEINKEASSTMHQQCIWVNEAIALEMTKAISNKLDRKIASKMTQGVTDPRAEIFNGLLKTDSDIRYPEIMDSQDEYQEFIDSQIDYHEILVKFANRISGSIFRRVELEIPSKMPHELASFGGSKKAAKAARKEAVQLSYTGTITQVAREAVRQVLHNLTRRITSSTSQEPVLVKVCKEAVQNISQEEAQFKTYPTIRRISFETMLAVLNHIDQHVASRMAGGQDFVKAYKEASATALQSVLDHPAMDLEEDPRRDPGLMPKIAFKVFPKVVDWAAARLALKPTMRSMTMISMDNQTWPGGAVTPEQLREWTSKQPKTEFLKRMEAGIQEEMAANGSAFQDFLDRMEDERNTPG